MVTPSEKGRRFAREGLVGGLELALTGDLSALVAAEARFNADPWSFEDLRAAVAALGFESGALLGGLFAAVAERLGEDARDVMRAALARAAATRDVRDDLDAIDSIVGLDDLLGRSDP